MVHLSFFCRIKPGNELRYSPKADSKNKIYNLSLFFYLTAAPPPDSSKKARDWNDYLKINCVLPYYHGHVCQDLGKLCVNYHRPEPAWTHCKVSLIKSLILTCIQTIANHYSVECDCCFYTLGYPSVSTMDPVCSISGDFSGVSKLNLQVTVAVAPCFVRHAAPFITKNEK